MACVGVHAVQSMYAACGTKKKRRMKATLYVTFEYAIENCGERVEPIGAPGSASNEMSTCVYISGRTWGSSDSVLMRESAFESDREREGEREKARERSKGQTDTHNITHTHTCTHMHTHAHTHHLSRVVGASEQLYLDLLAHGHSVLSTGKGCSDTCYGQGLSNWFIV